MRSRPLRVELTLIPSREVEELKARIDELALEVDIRGKRLSELEFKYRQEALLNLELLDLCREHGVPVRPAVEYRRHD